MEQVQKKEEKLIDKQEWATDYCVKAVFGESPSGMVLLLTSLVICLLHILVVAGIVALQIKTKLPIVEVLGVLYVGRAFTPWQNALARANPLARKSREKYYPEEAIKEEKTIEQKQEEAVLVCTYFSTQTIEGVIRLLLIAFVTAFFGRIIWEGFIIGAEWLTLLIN
jgi:hypothetical protein